jgi:hypothetical protein
MAGIAGTGSGSECLFCGREEDCKFSKVLRRSLVAAAMGGGFAAAWEFNCGSPVSRSSQSSDVIALRTVSLGDASGSNRA